VNLGVALLSVVVVVAPGETVTLVVVVITGTVVVVACGTVVVVTAGTVVVVTAGAVVVVTAGAVVVVTAGAVVVVTPGTVVVVAAAAWQPVWRQVPASIASGCNDTRPSVVAPWQVTHELGSTFGPGAPPAWQLPQLLTTAPGCTVCTPSAKDVVW
jgi:hypothetical protein